jgi:hypothetical protein
VALLLAFVDAFQVDAVAGRTVFVEELLAGSGVGQQARAGLRNGISLCL